MSTNDLSLRRSQPVTNTITLAAVVTAGVNMTALFLPLTDAQTVGIIAFFTLAIPYVAAVRARRLVTPNEYVAAEVIKTRVVTERDDEGRPATVEVKPVVVAGPAVDAWDGVPVEVYPAANPDAGDETGELGRTIPALDDEEDPGPYTEPALDDQGFPRDG